MLADPSALAPANSIYRFAELAAQELGDPHLGVKLGLDPRIVKWPVIADAFSASNVMVEFFSRFLLDAQRFTTRVEFHLRIGAETSWFERDRGFMPADSPAQIDALSVGLFVNIFRLVLGDGFQDREMLFRVCAPEVARIPALGQCALMKGDARKFAFSFPSEWLVLPIRQDRDAASPRLTNKPPSESLIAAIRSNIRSNMADPGLGVPALVAQMGFNRRAVQKYLRDRGSGLSDLIEEERQKLACELLDAQAMSVEEISDRLGYTDVSNFSRAFRRWTGLAPSRWRREGD
ncbi:helix-turn-helix domain-containing protein [Rhodobacteraceae bacterium KN286]|uniref:Helix-turn-helix domain-containing protein n=2 Tax=Oceanomicrobium pacificus TaxID=2692916 RepID=A0A6B0TJL6_9RHOB|nr:helix-turn-helix domain-containing protein [Oceanomicrobium pacificus]